MSRVFSSTLSRICIAASVLASFSAASRAQTPSDADLRRESIVALRPPTSAALSAASAGLGDPCQRLTSSELLRRLEQRSDIMLAKCVAQQAMRYSPLILRPAILELGDGSVVADGQTGVTPPASTLSASDIEDVLTSLLRIVGAEDDSASHRKHFDEVSRAYSASAAGRLIHTARRQSSRFHLSQDLVHTLDDCIRTFGPRAVRHACIKAAADGLVTDLIPALQSVVAPQPALDQFAAAQALTRLTGSQQITSTLASQAQTELKTFFGGVQ